MATIITAGNATNGLKITPDNTGILELKTGTGAGTTALTLNASQNATLAGTLQVAGVTTNMYPIVSGTAKAWNWNGLTTNKEIDFPDIPSWAKRITVMLNGVSTNGTSNAPLIQIGDSGGVETSGYGGYVTFLGSSVISSANSAGFLANHSVNATSATTGVATLCNISGNVWVFAWTGTYDNTAFTLVGSGAKTLSATLDRVRITTTSGADNFDAGTVNIMWE